MLGIIRQIFVPLLTLFIFLLGSGFFSTLLAIKMTMYHESPLQIGALTGIFYAGLIVGSLRTDSFIIKLGHIKAYTLFCSILAATFIVHGLIYHLGIWMAVRFVGGFVTAGIFVVIESWLLGVSNPGNRGRTLSLYMISFYGAQSLSQFLLNLGSPNGMMLFVITAGFCIISIFPLFMLPVKSPHYQETSKLDFRTLFTRSASGLLGSFSSGMVMGAIYGLMPGYLSQAFGSNAQVANSMFAIIFGGMLFQYPLGKLSDSMSKRLVLILISFATVAVCLLAIIHQPYWLFLSLMVIFGGLIFILYPISVSYACNAVEPRDLVAATQSLLLSYSIGAMIGPFIAPYFIHGFGNAGLFIYFGFISALLIPFLMLSAEREQVNTLSVNTVIQD